MRFDQLIRAGMTMREVRQAHPETQIVFEKYRFRESCVDCSLDAIARKHGVDAGGLVDELNQAITAADHPPVQ
jgi:hypothetical protein